MYEYNTKNAMMRNYINKQPSSSLINLVEEKKHTAYEKENLQKTSQFKKSHGKYFSNQNNS